MLGSQRRPKTPRERRMPFLGGEEFKVKIEFEEMVGSSSGWRGRGENLLIDNGRFAKALLHNDSRNSRAKTIIWKGMSYRICIMKTSV